MSANLEQSAGTTQSTLTKVLIANRGEIAVRIIRAARDEGEEPMADHVALRAAQQPGEGAIDVDDPAVGVDQDHRVARLRERRLEQPGPSFAHHRELQRAARGEGCIARNG